jgi:hypothetical protein
MHDDDQERTSETESSPRSHAVGVDEVLFHVFHADESAETAAIHPCSATYPFRNTKDALPSRVLLVEYRTASVVCLWRIK